MNDLLAQAQNGEPNLVSMFDQIKEGNWQQFWQEASQWLMTTGLAVLIILVIAIVCIKISSVLTRRFFQRFEKGRGDEYLKRSQTLAGIVVALITIVISVVAVIMILGKLGIPTAPILTAAGVLGIAVGFGAQHLVSDVISGFFILLDNEIRVGDVVQIAGKGGLVERVTLRMTILRDLAGNVHFIRNGQIDVVTNMTMEYSRYVFEIGVAYREDVDNVVEVVKQIDEEMRNDPVYGADILEPIEILGLDQFGDSAIVIKARTKTRPIRQWAVGREFNRRMKKRFDELNIEIPFPHVTLYMGQDKDGSAPPLKVQQENAG